jgi:hypothetical protein
MEQNLRKIAAAIFLGASVLGGVVSMQAQTPADRHYRCERRIHRAEANLQRAIRRFGEHSRQAERRRRELAEVRAQCGSQL